MVTVLSSVSRFVSCQAQATRLPLRMKTGSSPLDNFKLLCFKSFGIAILLAETAPHALIFFLLEQRKQMWWKVKVIHKSNVSLVLVSIEQCRYNSLSKQRTWFWQEGIFSSVNFGSQTIATIWLTQNKCLDTPSCRFSEQILMEINFALKFYHAFIYSKALLWLVHFFILWFTDVQKSLNFK